MAVCGKLPNPRCAALFPKFNMCAASRRHNRNNLLRPGRKSGPCNHWLRFNGHSGGRGSWTFIAVCRNVTCFNAFHCHGMFSDRFPAYFCFRSGNRRCCFLCTFKFRRDRFEMPLHRIRQDCRIRKPSNKFCVHRFLNRFRLFFHQEISRKDTGGQNKN